MAWTKMKMVVALAAASLLVVGTTTVVAKRQTQTTGTLQPQTFATGNGVYQWTNASSISELMFQNYKTRVVTLGTSSPPPAEAIIVDRWTNAASQSVLTVQSNAVQFATSDGLHNSSTSVNNWNVGRDWFIYRAAGVRVWAYDGHFGLWMLTVTPLSSELVPLQSLEDQPPAAVLRRLPAAVKKMLPQAKKH